MNRRDFLINSSLLASTTILSDDALANKKFKQVLSKKGLSILQGLTTPTSTQLVVGLEREAQVFYTLTDVETKKVFEPTSLRSVTYKSSEDRVDKLKFTGLELGHQYQLQVRDRRKKLIDDRFLKTADLNRYGAKIGVMSCMLDLVGNKNEIWRSAQAADLDYIFFIGDAVYGDLWIFHGPGFLWSRYMESRQSIPFYRWKHLKPVIAVWDDHDFGKNNKGADYKFKEQALEHFNTFFAQEPDQEFFFKGIGNSSFFRAFHQNFAFFDNRFYRGLLDPAGQPGFFGEDQINWMLQGVANNPNPTWILNGSPIFGRLEKTASYEVNAPAELELFLKKVRSTGAPVIFGAGDLHYSEVSEIPKEYLGYKTFELVSSCMHSTKRKKYYDNPNPHLNGYLQENFLMFEQVGLAGDPAWKVTCVAKDLETAFELDIEV